jgi:hypothetical protein
MTLRAVAGPIPLAGGDRGFESLPLRQRVSLTGAFHGHGRERPGFAGGVSRMVSMPRSGRRRNDEPGRVSFEEAAARWLEDHPKWELDKVRCSLGNQRVANSGEI